MNDLIAAGVIAWAVAALFALTGRVLPVARLLLFCGCGAVIAAALMQLPEGTAAVALPTTFAGAPVKFILPPDALWLLGFGLAPAALACAVSTPSPSGQAGWLFGAAASLIGAVGVFGLQDGASFLVAWEVMSFGGAVMILSEKLSLPVGGPVLFMLGLLEVGAVALIAVVLLLADHNQGFAFDAFRTGASGLPAAVGVLVGLLLLIGFGAKLGLLPFYEWFPGAYGAGSGASGALLSGVVLNAAFFGLSRGLLDWLPGSLTLQYRRTRNLRSRDRCRNGNPQFPLCFSGGGLARPAELFFGGKCRDCGGDAWRRHDVSRAKANANSQVWPGPSPFCISPVTPLPKEVCS